MPGTPVFHNLTLGFEVRDGAGRWRASCVDDLTLQADLQRSRPPRPGWYRVLSDDERLLRLIARHADPGQPLDRVLDPIADLFGTRVRPGPDGMLRVDDASGSSVALGAPLPGERERPCELVTAPFEPGQAGELEGMLELARGLGWTAPAEGAIHLHFEAAPLQAAGPFANLVLLLHRWGPALKPLLATNPRCRRLGEWPPALLEIVSEPTFRQLSWPCARERLLELKLSKYCDFNLLNCVLGLADKNTVEIRILPVWLESGPILAAARLFESLLRRALEPEPVAPRSLSELLERLPLWPEERAGWLTTVREARAAEGPPLK